MSRTSFLLHPLSASSAVLLLVLAAGCSTSSTTKDLSEPLPPGEPSQMQRVEAASPVTANAPVSAAVPTKPFAEPRASGIVTAGAAARAPTVVSARKREAADLYASTPPPPPMLIVAPQPQDTAQYAHLDPNGVIRAIEQPVSTFSVDVDTASYSNVRRFLNEGRLPPQDAVRVEEMINYFEYADAAPRDRSQPFAVHTEIAPTPWNARTKLLRIGLHGWEPKEEQLPPSNLVFLVDVSGSMMSPERLPLAKSALRLLARQMRHEDRISLVVYAGNTGVVLEPTPGDQTATIESALDRLEAGGSTNGAGGIELAYQVARKAFIPGGNNRILLATDGDFNVGTTSFESLKNLVEERRKSGIALSTLGFGTANLNDRLMEQLADAGNGAYDYIDSMKEAQKALVQQRAGTLTTIAKDVKIQVEFNPQRVAEYRLIGYENRQLKREDFNNDKVDAGDIGAGHRVTALYEVALVGEGGEASDTLRYGSEPSTGGKSDELAFLRLRYKRPQDGTSASSRLIETPIRARDVERADATSDAFRLSAAVAAYGQLLHGGRHTGDFGFDDVQTLARSARGYDPHGYTGEFIQLAALAGSLETRQARVETRPKQDD